MSERDTASSAKREKQLEQELQEQEIRAKLKLFFRETLQAFGKKTSTDPLEGISRNVFEAAQAIALFVGCNQEDFKKGEITAQAQKRIRIFFEELIDFVQEARKSDDQSSVLERYLGAWKQSAFAVSPSLANWLNIEDRFTTASRLTRIPECAQTLAPSVSAELVDDLLQMKDSKKFFSSIYNRERAIDTKLDIVHFINAIGCIALEGSSAELSCAEGAFKTLQELALDPHQSPFIHYVAIHGRDNLRQRYQLKYGEEARSVVWRWVSREDVETQQSRPKNSSSEDHLKIKARIIPDSPPRSYTTFGRIARDAIGVFDRRQYPLEFALVAPRRLDTEGGIPEPVHIERFERFEENRAILPKGASHGMNMAILFQEIHARDTRDMLERDMGIALTDLSMREQAQLIGYLVSCDVETTKKGFEFIRRFGVDGARTFLSCEYGLHFGELIRNVGEQLDHESAQAIFKRYGEIINLTERTAEELYQAFYNGKTKKIFNRSAVIEELLRRAKDILVMFAEQASLKQKPDAKRVLHLLERFEQDTVFFASMFKTAAQEYGIEFQELHGILFERKQPKDISDNERAQMLDIAYENWMSQQPELADWIKKGLAQKLDTTNESSSFYVLKRKEKIVAFMRFDTRPDLGEATLYSGSLNVSPELRGSALGETMMMKALDVEAKGRVIYADFFPEVKAGTMYVEEMGCVVVGVEDVVIDAKGTKRKRLLLERNDRVNARYKSRQEKINLETVLTKSFTFPGDVGDFVKTVEHETRAGYVMTRYIVDTKNPNIRHCVFEPRADYSSSARVAA